MWNLTYTKRTSASREAVWASYEDFSTTPEWDPLVAEIRTNGPLAVGRKGHNKPKRGPALPSVVTEVTPGTSYTEVVRLPGASTSWSHVLADAGPDLEITHAVTCTGPLAAVYGLLFRRSFEQGMPVALDGLARRAAATAARA